MDRNIKVARELVGLAREIVSASRPGKFDEFREVSRCEKAVKKLMPAGYKTAHGHMTFDPDGTAEGRWIVSKSFGLGNGTTGTISLKLGIDIEPGEETDLSRKRTYQIQHLTSADTEAALGYSHNDAFFSTRVQCKDIQEYKVILKQVFDALEEKIVNAPASTAHPAAKAQSDNLKDELADMFNANCESIKISGDTIRLFITGKAWGDGYDFHEVYKNGKCVECDSACRYSRLAEHLYRTYGFNTIVVDGYKD